MEILTRPRPPNAMTRDRWLAAFVDGCLPHERPMESPEVYRDAGSGVVLRFRNGGEARWLWANISPADALQEAYIAGWLSEIKI